jgi:light-regulated signal transduction histidine kinase (bacteriophytochrome)
MGVQASLSISILKRGKLWGLFACHHESPRVLGYEVRTAAELFGQLFSFVLDQKESDEGRDEQERAQSLHDQLMAQLAEDASILTILIPSSAVSPRSFLTTEPLGGLTENSNRSDIRRARRNFLAW